MKTLYLQLKAQWYEMIEAGVKEEEYREITDYWRSRIWRNQFSTTHVCFIYTYTKRRMTFEVEKITIGRGNPEWGAPEDRNVFIIKFK